MSDCKHKFIDELFENGCSIALCEHCRMTEDEVTLQARVEKLEAFIDRDAEYIRKIRSKKIKLKKQVEELEVEKDRNSRILIDMLDRMDHVLQAFPEVQPLMLKLVGDMTAKWEAKAEGEKE